MQRHRALKKFVRVLVVILTWGLVALVPDQNNSFFEGMIVAAAATMGEYFSILLDEESRPKFYMSFVGMGLGVFFLIIGIMGLGKLITLNVKTMVMSLGTAFPVPDPTAVHWTYYHFVACFLVFVIIPVVEAMFRPRKKKENNDHEEKEIAHPQTAISTSNPEVAGGGK